MMTKSKAFIAVDRDDTNPHAPSRLFHIDGDREAVAAARALIKEKVAAVLHGKPNARVHDASGGSLTDHDRDDDDDEISAPLEMWIPKGCVGMIIGHGGQVISEMQDRSGSTIVVHNNKMDRHGAKLLTISGGEREKLHARELIQNVLDRAGMRNRAVDYHQIPDAPQWGFHQRPIHPQHPAAAAQQWFFAQQQGQQLPFDPRTQVPDFRFPPYMGGWMHPMQMQMQHPAQQLAPGVLAHPHLTAQNQQQHQPPTPNTPPTQHQQQQQIQQQMQQQQHHHQQLQQQQQHVHQHQLQAQHLQHQQAQQQQQAAQQQQPQRPQQQVQRGPVMQAPQISPHINPLYPHSAQVPWNPQLPYPMQQMQVPFDQNSLLSTHPMLKIATKAVPVPSSCVGIVIGRSGETIRDLQQRSGAHIKVTPDKDAKDDAPVRVIFISGTPPALELAHSLVNDVINEGLTRSYRDGVEPRAITDLQESGGSHETHFEHEQGRHSDDHGSGPTVSQRGSSDKDGTDRDACQFASEGQRRDTGKTSDTIDYTDSETFPELGVAAKNDKGGGSSSSKTKNFASNSTDNTPDEGDTTEQTDHDHAWSQGEGEEDAPNPNDEQRSAGAESSVFPFTGEGRVVQRPATDYPSASISFEMKIPHAKVGVIIGKNGSTIRLLQQKSGARIVVSKKIDKTREDNPRAVMITGPEAFVDTARRLIVQKINPPAEGQSQMDDKDASLDPLDFDDTLLAGDQAMDSLAMDLANQSLTSPLPPMVPGSPSSVSPMRISQTPPYGPYSRPTPFVSPNRNMQFSGQQYQSMRSIGRSDGAEYRPMDPQTQQQVQYAPQFMGQVAQPLAERVPVAQGFTFPQSPESSETMQQGFGEFRPDQFYLQGGNIFGLPVDGTGNVLSEAGAHTGQTFQGPVSQELGGEDPVYSYQVEGYNQQGTEPSSAV